MPKTITLEITENALKSSKNNAKRIEIFNIAFEKLDIIGRMHLADKFPDLYKRFAEHVMHVISATNDNQKQDVFNKLYSLLDILERERLGSTYPKLNENYGDFFNQKVLSDISKDLKRWREKTGAESTKSEVPYSLDTPYYFGNVIEDFKPEETGNRNVSSKSGQETGKNDAGYKSIFKNKIESGTGSTIVRCLFAFQEPLPVGLWKRIVDAFDSVNIRLGTDHWWGTNTADDKPSARPRKTKSGIIHIGGVDFTEGKLSMFLAISKDGKELYVDSNGTSDNVSGVLKNNGFAFKLIDDAYLNL